jgi:hypothetical protein
LEHVVVHKAIRATGDAQTLPMAHDAPWPKEFLPLVEKRLDALRGERRTIAEGGNS